MNITRRTFIATVLASLMIFPLVASAATSEKELQEHFKERYPKVLELKKAGIVGEQYDGYIGIVDEKAADKEAKQLVEQENADRKELFKLIAEREKTTAEKVAERFAKRAFDKAQPGEYLKGADGKWKKKEAPPAR